MVQPEMPGRRKIPAPSPPGAKDAGTREHVRSSVSPRRPVERLDPAVPDGELVRRAQAGEGWAEEALYRRHAPALGNLAARVLRDPEAALDAVQDAFVATLDNLHAIRDPEAVASWLRRVVINKVHRRLRRRRLRRVLGLVRGDPDAEHLAELTSGEVPAERRAELALVHRVLQTLPADVQVAWALRTIEGYTIAEVADACGVSESTAKRRVREAQEAIEAHVEGASGE